MAIAYEMFGHLFFKAWHPEPFWTLNHLSTACNSLPLQSVRPVLCRLFSVSHASPLCTSTQKSNQIPLPFNFSSYCSVSILNFVPVTWRTLVITLCDVEKMPSFSVFQGQPVGDIKNVLGAVGLCFTSLNSSYSGGVVWISLPCCGYWSRSHTLKAAILHGKDTSIGTNEIAPPGAHSSHHRAWSDLIWGMAGVGYPPPPYQSRSILPP